MGDSDLLYRSLLREISHALRSPLGVVLGVVDDHLQGYSCSIDDFEAARHSLAKIKNILDLIKHLGFGSNNPQQVNLRDFLLAQEAIRNNQRLLCSAQNISSSLEVHIDPFALASFLKLILMLLQQTEENEFVLEASITADLENSVSKIVLQVYGTRKSDNQLVQSGSDACFTLQQFGLQEIVWELLKTNCSHHHIECRQVLDTEKNTRFILTFR